MRDRIHDAGYYVDVDTSDRTIQKKVLCSKDLIFCLNQKQSPPFKLGLSFLILIFSLIKKCHEYLIFVQVREAQVAQYNYILVVGEEEANTGQVNFKQRILPSISVPGFWLY